MEVVIVSACQITKDVKVRYVRRSFHEVFEFFWDSKTRPKWRRGENLLVRGVPFFFYTSLSYWFPNFCSPMWVWILWCCEEDIVQQLSHKLNPNWSLFYCLIKIGSHLSEILHMLNWSTNWYHYIHILRVFLKHFSQFF